MPNVGYATDFSYTTLVEGILWYPSDVAVLQHHRLLFAGTSWWTATQWRASAPRKHPGTVAPTVKQTQGVGACHQLPLSCSSRIYSLQLQSQRVGSAYQLQRMHTLCDKQWRHPYVCLRISLKGRWTVPNATGDGGVPYNCEFW